MMDSNYPELNLGTDQIGGFSISGLRSWYLQNSQIDPVFKKMLDMKLVS